MKRRTVFRIIICVSVALVLAVVAVYLSYKRKHDRCWASVVSKVAGTTDLATALHSELEEFQVLVEHSLVARTMILTVLEELKQKKEGPLSGRDLETLRSGTVAYIDLREELYDIAERYECTIDVGDIYLKRNRLDPLLRSKAVLLSLAAALTLNDNWILAVASFQNEPRLRRLLNDPDSGFGIDANTLAMMSRAANSLTIRERVRHAIYFYEKDRKKLFRSKQLRERVEQDNDYLYLDLLIRSSPSYNMLRERRAGTFLVRQLDEVGRISTDFIHELGKDGMDLLSKFFGNTVGMVETRKGKLYEREEVISHLTGVLEPLDILLEKTPFRLTDLCIPGHFGHVAIWLGTEQELKGLGLWEHPVVRPYHAQLRSSETSRRGKKALIVEALRSGVQLSTLEDFVNVDDLAVLRPTAVTESIDDAQREALTKEALLLAFRQVGKEYDFNFDIHTTEKIVCSELVYVSFPSIAWPTDQVMGRYTISPDNVAKQALEGSPLRLVLFYHDGELIADDQEKRKALQVFRKLVESAN